MCVCFGRVESAERLPQARLADRTPGRSHSEKWAKLKSKNFEIKAHQRRQLRSKERSKRGDTIKPERGGEGGHAWPRSSVEARGRRNQEGIAGKMPKKSKRPNRKKRRRARKKRQLVVRRGRMTSHGRSVTSRRMATPTDMQGS